MSDALALLRQATIAGHLASVRLVGDNLLIGEHSFPRKTQTLYNHSKTGVPYELDAIWFFLANADLKPSDLYRGTKTAKVVDINPIDKKPLLAYMRGLVDSVPNLAGGQADATEKKATLGHLVSTTDAQSDPTLKPLGQWSLSDIYAQEKWLSTTGTILQNLRDTDLSSAVQMFQDAVRKRQTSDPKGQRKEGVAPVQRLNPVLPAEKKQKQQPQQQEEIPETAIPIIVVPQANSAVINMFNVKEFLHLGLFKSQEEKRIEDEKQRANGEPEKKKPELEICERKSFLNPSRNCKYYVVDNITKITPDMWPRVVAVFATGADWQLKGWPWKTPAEIFANVKAYHLFYDDEALNPKIAKWNIHKLPISKIKRYRDRSVVTDFWSTLEHFINTKNTQRQLFF